MRFTSFNGVMCRSQCYFAGDIAFILSWSQSWLLTLSAWFLSLCPTDTTHICRSARASGSRRTSSTSTTPNCSSSALPQNSRSAWTLGEGAARATSTSSPTSFTPCSTSSTRTWRRRVSLTPVAIISLARLTRVCTVLLLLLPLAGRGPRRGRRRTCRLSRSSRRRSGWRARTRWRGRTTTPCWPCTSCRQSAGGPRGYTSCGGCSSARTHARSLQAAPTSRIPILCNIITSYRRTLFIPQWENVQKFFFLVV